MRARVRARARAWPARRPSARLPLRRRLADAWPPLRAVDERDPIYDPEQDDPAYVLVSRHDKDASAAARAGVTTSLVGSPPRDGYMAPRSTGGAGGSGGDDRMTLAEFKKKIIPVIMVRGGPARRACDAARPRD